MTLRERVAVAIVSIVLLGMVFGMLVESVTAKQPPVDPMETILNAQYITPEKVTSLLVKTNDLMQYDLVLDANGYVASYMVYNDADSLVARSN